MRMRSGQRKICCLNAMPAPLDGRFDPPQGSGYAVDSFWSAIHCLLATGSYEACVKRAVALGNDTDTTAAIAGGLAGLLYGMRAIPDRWCCAVAWASISY